MQGAFMNRWVVLLMIVFAAITWFFWHDLQDLAADGMADLVSTQPETPVLREGDLTGARKVFFLAPDAVPGGLQVSAVRVDTNDGSRVTLSMYLAGVTTAGAYPVLQISLMNQQGTRLRTLVFDGNQYQHDARVSDGRVSVAFGIRPGEEKFGVLAKY